MTDAPSVRNSRLAEAVVITLSILVAFGIDAWWDGIQQKAEDRSHMQNVRRELVATDELLDDAVRLHGLTESLALEVLRMTSSGKLTVPADSLDALTAKLYNSYVINPPTGALQAAILSGAVARLPDEALKTQLLGWDSLLEDLLEEEQNGFQGAREFGYFLADRVSVWGPTSQIGVSISGETVAELPWELPPTRHTTGVETLLDDVEFENAVLILLSNARASLDEATEFQGQLQDVLARLDRTLD